MSKLSAKKKQKKTREFSLSDGSSLSEMLRCHFDCGLAVILTEEDRAKIVNMASNTSQEEALTLAKQVLLYLRTAVAEFQEVTVVFPTCSTPNPPPQPNVKCI